jgi:hypothetical protein
MEALKNKLEKIKNAIKFRFAKVIKIAPSRRLSLMHRSNYRCDSLSKVLFSSLAVASSRVNSSLFILNKNYIFSFQG